MGSIKCFLFFIFFAPAVLSGLSELTITPRKDWGAKPSAAPLQHISDSCLPVPYVIVHHSPGFICPVNDSCAGTVRNIQRNSIENKRFPDLSFNFLVAPSGEIYEGRGWSVVGSHAPGYNGRSCGICVMGNYSNTEPSTEAVLAVQNLIKAGVTLGHISPEYKLVAHRQVRPRDCPGDALYAAIQKWPNWESNPKK